MKKIFLLSCLLLLDIGNTSADDCKPYFEQMLAEKIGTKFRVHGVKNHYDGQYPDGWYISLIMKKNTVPYVGFDKQPAMSEENDHFVMEVFDNVGGGLIKGEYMEVSHPAIFSKERTVEVKRSGYSGADMYINGYSGIGVNCYRINDNPNQFAVEGSHSEGVWIFNHYLFSIEKINNL